MTNIMNSWTFPYSPYLNQATALEWLQTNQDKKYLILESPVGSGKSFIGMAYAKYLGGRSFVLTPQKILQRQYEESFKPIQQIELASFYGKSNYTCRSKNTTCNIGSLVKPRCESCPYNNARDYAIKSTNTVMNYKLALSAWAYTSLFDGKDNKPLKRRLMVLDECHTLEQHLVSFDALAITEWRCKKYDVKWKPQRTMADAIAYMRDSYIPHMTLVINRLDEQLEFVRDKAPSDLTKTDQTKLQELEDLMTHVLETCAAFVTQPLKALNDKFVLVHNDISFEFRRLSGAQSFKAIIEPMADQFLFMSSTVLDKDGFCDDIGISRDDTAFLSLGSEFDIENRPVYYMPQCKMNYKWRSPENTDGLASMLAAINQLCTMHADQSGIIHTANFAVADWLVNNISIDQDIFHHNPQSGDDRGAIIDAFINHNKPSVLISPSCTEGLDLKGDLSRFAIFAKVPYGFLGDQWIKRRMEMSAEWYQRQAIINIIQGGGRVVRDMNDCGTVYILDQNFAFLLTKTHRLIPQWWKDAYQKL